MDRRIDERFRKPRRSIGTPLYYQRNYWAVGTLAFGGFCWFLLEQLPLTKRFKKFVQEETGDPDLIKEKKLQAHISLTDPVVDQLFGQVRAR